ncbi:hypothetical protein R1flu_016097 [Riccia fluitans]|uniref:Uncharacterized protein n=1 Tax=Riccia fluitans TaxID=41844 RepID=A0ABD1YKV1_9MARC
MVLSWVDLNCNLILAGDTATGEKPSVDILSEIRANLLINFAVFSFEEQAVYTKSLHMPNASSVNELAARTDDGDPYVLTDSARMIEYRVSEKNAMMWDIPNMNNLAPMTLEMWQKLIHASDSEQKTCLYNALNGVTPSKMVTMKDTIKMSCFRDKYRCGEPVSIRVKTTITIDSNRVPKHKSILWNWLWPYIWCNCKSDGKHEADRNRCKGEMLWWDDAIWYIFNHLSDFFPQSIVEGRYMAFLIFLGGEARPAVLAHLSFLHVCKLMLDTAMEVFANPKARTLLEHGDAYGVCLIEQMMKPASFSDELISKETQTGTRRGLALQISPILTVPRPR